MQKGSEPARGVAGRWLLGSRPLPLPNWSPVTSPSRRTSSCTLTGSSSTGAARLAAAAARTAARVERRRSEGRGNLFSWKLISYWQLALGYPPPPLYLHCADVPLLSIPVKQIRINNGDNLSTWQRVGGDVWGGRGCACLRHGCCTWHIAVFASFCLRYFSSYDREIFTQ